jgi:predicted MFS family arabinose efflux permease
MQRRGDEMSTTTGDRPGTIRQALHEPLFRRLLAALAISQTGNWLYNVALLAVVYERTHSATWVAVTTAARVVPIVVCGPFGGVVADRCDRRRVMIASDTIQAGAMLVLAGVAAAGWPIVLAPVLAGLATVAASPYPSCVAATTPRLVAEDRLAGANAARSAVGSACIVVGPALGGLLMATTSSVAAFVANAASFALSALLVASLPAGDRFAPVATEQGADRPRLLGDLAAGVRALRGSPVALRLVGADISCSVVYGAQTVLFVLVARSLGYGADGYGWLLAGCGLGGVLGTAVAARAADAHRPRLVLALALLAVAVPLPLLVVTHSILVALLLAMVGGAGAILVEVLADTGLQRCLDEEVLGRAYGFALPAAIAGIVVGSLLAAPLVALLGADGALVALGALVTVHALALLRSSGSRESREAPAAALAAVAAGDAPAGELSPVAG